MSIYIAEVGKLGERRYVGRVLKDGVLDWQSRKIYVLRGAALLAAQRRIRRQPKEPPQAR